MKILRSLALPFVLLLLLIPTAAAQDLIGLPMPEQEEFRQEVTAIRQLIPGETLLEPNAVCSEVEPNNNASLADPMTVPGSCSGSAASSDPGDYVVTYSGGASDDIEDVFRIQLASPGTITLHLTFTSGGDLDLFLFRMIGSTPNPLANSSKTNTTSESLTSYQAAGTYYVGVSAYSGSSSYTVEVSATGQGVTVNAPSNLQAQAISSSVIQLTWNDNSNNETGFRVEQKNSSQVFVDIGNVAANATGVNVTGFSPGQTGTFRVRAYSGSTYSSYSNEASATVGGASLCVPDATTVCLLGNRFRVSIVYHNPIANQDGTFLAARLFQGAANPDVGLFGFSNPQAIEVVVRIQDTRPFANRFDVYYGGMTDFPYVVTVTDTQTGTTRQYTFNGGTPAGGVDRTSFPAN